MSLDNKLGEDGIQTAISNRMDFEFVHTTRNQLAAIGVGSNTILVDNPSLSTREEYFTQDEAKLTHPIPIIFDRRGRIPKDARVITRFPERPVLLVTNRNSPNYPENVMIIKSENSILLKDNINSALDHFERDGPVMIEGGTELLYTMIKKGIIDDIRIYTNSSALEESTLRFIFPDTMDYQLLMVKRINSGYERIYRLYS